MFRNCVLRRVGELVEQGEINFDLFWAAGRQAQNELSITEF